MAWHPLPQAHLCCLIRRWHSTPPHATSCPGFHEKRQSICCIRLLAAGPLDFPLKSFIDVVPMGASVISNAVPVLASHTPHSHTLSCKDGVQALICWIPVECYFSSIILIWTFECVDTILLPHSYTFHVAEFHVCNLVFNGITSDVSDLL